MTFKNQLATDMAEVILNTDEFAEDIVYTPKGGNAATIAAIVLRTPINAGSEDQARVLRRDCEIIIQNGANGVTSVDTKGDKVAFPVHPGGDSEDWDVISIVEAGVAHWKLKVSR